MKELTNLISAESGYILQQATWVFSICTEKDAGIVNAYWSLLFNCLEKCGDSSVKRNILRSIEKIKVPVKYQGKFTDCCTRFLADPKEPVAVKVYSMTILAGICSDHPDLANEVKLLISSGMEEGSAGYKSRGRKILMQFSKPADQNT